MNLPDLKDRILALFPQPALAAAADGMDARRLDWLLAHNCNTTHSFTAPNYGGMVIAHHKDRAGIDAAMSADGGKKL